MLQMELFAPYMHLLVSVAVGGLVGGDELLRVPRC